MRTIKQIQAARANGAKSKGPITPAGKARSALNGVTHGLTARSVVLAVESTERFEALLNALVDRYQPADQAEFLCLEEMAWAKWRIRRAVNLETIMMDGATTAADPDAHEAARTAQAFENLHRDSSGFRNLRRHEATHYRNYFRSLQELVFLQSQRRPQPAQTEPEVIEVEVSQ